MKTSSDRILTTHAGSLPRPESVLDFIRAMNDGPVDEKDFDKTVTEAVTEVVKRQADIGIDVPTDGEFSKPSFLSYITDRLDGVDHTGEPFGNPWAGSKEIRDFPEYYAWEASLGLMPAPKFEKTIVSGPLKYVGHDAVKRDIERFKKAMDGLGFAEAFMPAISPSNVEFWIKNQYYNSEEDYVMALADALHEEYKAITDAGLILQIDDPRLVTYYVMAGEASVKECRDWAEVRVEALNRATKGLPKEQVRFHTCYSIDMGPRTNDMELKDIIDIILKINAGAYSFEGANPRHEHEWREWGKVKLPDDVILIPGVITHSTNLVEHPEVVADRIERYAGVVGKDRVIAGADCGFGTFAGSQMIHHTVAWAKLKALVDGAELATKRLRN